MEREQKTAEGFLAVGNCLLDLFRESGDGALPELRVSHGSAQVPSGQVSSRETDELPAFHRMTAGGSPVNVATALAMHGYRCGVVGAVGADGAGAMLREQLGRWPAVGDNLVVEEGEQTGYALYGREAGTSAFRALEIEPPPVSGVHENAGEIIESARWRAVYLDGYFLGMSAEADAVLRGISGNHATVVDLAGSFVSDAVLAVLIRTVGDLAFSREPITVIAGAEDVVDADRLERLRSVMEEASHGDRLVEKHPGIGVTETIFLAGGGRVDSAEFEEKPLTNTVGIGDAFAACLLQQTSGAPSPLYDWNKAHDWALDWERSWAERTGRP